MPKRSEAQEFQAFVQEAIADAWDAHEDFGHETIDPYGPDDTSNVRCLEPEEHASLERVAKYADRLFDPSEKGPHPEVRERPLAPRDSQ